MESFLLNGVPAALWGPPSDAVLLAVHGNRSHKADTVIALLAAQFGCALDEMPEGEHFFHTPEQLAYYTRWLDAHLPDA